MTRRHEGDASRNEGRTTLRVRVGVANLCCEHSRRTTRHDEDVVGSSFIETELMQYRRSVGVS